MNRLHFESRVFWDAEFKCQKSYQAPWLKRCYLDFEVIEMFSIFCVCDTMGTMI